jgi:hypothetical protein
MSVLLAIATFIVVVLTLGFIASFAGWLGSYELLGILVLALASSVLVRQLRRS